MQGKFPLRVRCGMAAYKKTGAVSRSRVRANPPSAGVRPDCVSTVWEFHGHALWTEASVATHICKQIHDAGVTGEFDAVSCAVRSRSGSVGVL